MPRLISSDLFNPMLVRDLRQGLRSNLFALTFLVLQGSMAFFVVAGLVSGQTSNLSGLLMQTLGAAVVLLYILVLPTAATFSFATEFRQNRIDLLKLTQISARSLVWGKWFSLIAQGVMVFASMLPFLILTYFFGGVDLVNELYEVGFVLAASALLIGVCVALSCFNTMIFRIFLVIGLLYLTKLCFDMINQPRFLSSTISGQSAGVTALLFLCLGVPAIFLLMELGAYCLASASENHDTPQRLVALGLVAFEGLIVIFDTAYPGPFLDRFKTESLFFASYIGIWVLMFAAAAEPSPYPDTYRPFVRWGVLGRFIGRTFLYPGWPSAAPFIILVAASTSLILPMPDLRHFLEPFLLLPAAMLFPQIGGWLLLGRRRYGAGARYFIVAAVCLVVFMAATVLYGVTQNPDFAIIACAFPPDAWFFLSKDLLFKEGILQTDCVILSTFTSSLTMVVVCFRMIRYWKNFTKLEALAISSEKERRRRPSFPTGPAGLPPLAEKSARI